AALAEVGVHRHGGRAGEAPTLVGDHDHLLRAGGTVAVNIGGSPDDQVGADWITTRAIVDDGGDGAVVAGARGAEVDVGRAALAEVGVHRHGGRAGEARGLVVDDDHLLRADR